MERKYRFLPSRLFGQCDFFAYLCGMFSKKHRKSTGFMCRNRFDWSRLCSMLFLLALAFPAFAQQRVSGQVVDAQTGKGVPYATVYVNPSKGTLTNDEGTFSIEVDSSATLRISSIGYEKCLLKATGVPSKVKLKPVAKSLREVVVKPVEVDGLLERIIARLAEDYKKQHSKKRKYFYRTLLTDGNERSDLVEAFMQAESVVNLRDLKLLSGIKGHTEDGDSSQLAFFDTNMYNVVQGGPRTEEDLRWSKIIKPFDDAKVTRKMFDVEAFLINGEENEKIYRMDFSEKKKGKEQRGMGKYMMLTGTAYVDSATCRLLRFDGEALRLIMSLGMLNVANMDMKFHVDYDYSDGVAEVNTVAVRAGGNFGFNSPYPSLFFKTLLFHVEDSIAESVKTKKKNGVNLREALFSAIEEAGYDSQLWDKYNIVERTAEEQRVAFGESADSTSDERSFVKNLSHSFYDREIFPYVRRMIVRGSKVPQEKVYVHMDNTSYCLGDTLWFSAYVMQTNNDLPSTTSGVLYVELLNQDGYLVERKLIELEKGRGHGEFALNKLNMYAGFYELRAYTRWQLNWGQTQHPHSFMAKRWFYNPEFEQRYYRDFDKLYSRVFPVYDKQTDNNVFVRDMSLRPLQRNYKEKEERKLQLTLYPESGNILASKENHVAFEAAWDDGRWAEGWLLVGNDSVPAEHRGRGTFLITPEENKRQTVTFVSKDGTRVEAKLPQAEKKGVTVHVQQEKNECHFLYTFSDDFNPDELGVTVSCEGRVELCGTLSNPECSSVTLNIPGVHQITVFDSNGYVWADRLFFVQPEEMEKGTLQIKGLKKEYKPYEKVELSIQNNFPYFVPEGNGTECFSLAVRDAERQDHLYDNGNILTEMLLSSEIKGFVPDPGWYFEKNDEEHRRALDLLMLTQGWRRFVWRDMAVKGEFELTHPWEKTSQVLSGKVYRASNADPRWRKVMLAQSVLGGSMAGDFDPYEEDREKMDSKDERNEELRPGFKERIVSPKESWRDRNEVKTNGDIAKGESYVRSMTVSSEDTLRIPDFQTVDGGYFDLRLPHFYGDCVLFLAAQSDKKYKAEKPYVWKEMSDPQYLTMKELRKSEIYPSPLQVILDLPYPRFVKPYDYYQNHLSIPSVPGGNDRVEAQNGAILMKELDVKAMFKGKREFNDAHPAFMLDALDAENAEIDAGMYRAPDLLVSTYLGDMGQESVKATNEAETIMKGGGTFGQKAFETGDGIRHRFGADSHLKTIMNIPVGSADSTYAGKYLKSFSPTYNLPPGEIRRFLLQGAIEKHVVYTDYSPRLEGDSRYVGSNQPEVQIADYPYADNLTRPTYQDRCLRLQGFSVAAEFYHPNYSKHTLPEGQQDYRRTLYWNPDLKLNKKGEAEVTFWNGSRTTRLSAEAEGMTAKGFLLFTTPSLP